MKLFEYQAKELFKTYGLPVPNSVLAKNVGEAEEAYRRLTHPVVLKAQVLAGGRGKAGGVVVVSNQQDVAKQAQRILSLSIGGEKPSALLVEESFAHSEEMYLSIALDRGERRFVVVASKTGGVDVESVAGKVMRQLPLDGIDQAFANQVASEIGLGREMATKFASILVTLEKLAREKECELAEINPLAVGDGGRFMALDAKMIIDDSALFRHPELSKIHPEDMFEGEASRQGFAFVHLDGDIAVVGNGAGLVLSTLDLVGDAGGKAACFLDLGGGAQEERMEAALRLANRLPNASRILLNIYGGITRTTDVAEAIKVILSEGEVKPIYARISGAEEAEARKMLTGTQVRLFPTAPEAVRAVVEAR